MKMHRYLLIFALLLSIECIAAPSAKEPDHKPGRIVPVQPIMPVQPAAPVKPAAPVQPAAPVKPAVPVQPAVHISPMVQFKPGLPDDGRRPEFDREYGRIRCRLEMPDECRAGKTIKCRLTIDARKERLDDLRVHLTFREGKRTAKIMQFKAKPERNVSVKNLRPGNYTAEVRLVAGKNRTLAEHITFFTVKPERQGRRRPGRHHK